MIDLSHCIGKNAALFRTLGNFRLVPINHLLGKIRPHDILLLWAAPLQLGIDSRRPTDICETDPVPTAAKVTTALPCKLAISGVGRPAAGELHFYSVA